MKFDYENPNAKQPECVAYLDDDGDLFIKDHDGDCVAIGPIGVLLSAKFDPELATCKFYPGDKITITF